MPRVDVPVTQITRSAVAPAAEVTGDPVNNHSIANDGTMWFEARNASTTVARVVTVNFSRKVDGQTVSPRTYSIPLSDTRRIGPFPPGDYGAPLLVDVDNADLKLTAYRTA
jgi:hypothetical protein